MPFVVTGESGCYSGTSWWVVRVFDTRAGAEVFIKALDADLEDCRASVRGLTTPQYAWPGEIRPWPVEMPRSELDPRGVYSSGEDSTYEIQEVPHGHWTTEAGQ
jgi:hypothetical protein